MPTNGLNNVEDAEMADSDGEKVVTMMDVLQEQQDFEDDANAVLGASDEKNCTYSKGYIKRQAIYACLTCCSDAKEDPTKRAGVCLACSLNCHENHELIELYTKRNFRCDCGNPKFNTHPCQFVANKCDLNLENKYNQNFSGLYCNCHRPYPDPEATEEDEMIQCIICEDWLHAAHLDAVVPGHDQYSEMICKACMDNNDFLHDYNSLAVNTEELDVDITTLNESNNDVGNLEDEKCLNSVTVADITSKPSDIDAEEESEKSYLIQNNCTVKNQPLEEFTEDNSMNIAKDVETDSIEKPQLEDKTEDNSVNISKESNDKEIEQPVQEVSNIVNPEDTKTDLDANVLDKNNAISTDNIQSNKENSKNPEIITTEDSYKTEEVVNNTDLNGEDIKDSTENISTEVEASAHKDITEAEYMEEDTDSGKEIKSTNEPDTETTTVVSEHTVDGAGENKNEIHDHQDPENITTEDTSKQEDVVNNTNLSVEDMTDSTENMNTKVEANPHNDITESEYMETDTDVGKEIESMNDPNTETKTVASEHTEDEAGENKNEIHDQQDPDEGEITKIVSAKDDSSLTSPNESEITASITTIQETRIENTDSQNQTEEITTDKDSNEISTDQEIKGDTNWEEDEILKDSNPIAEECENITHTNTIKSNGINENKRKLSTDQLVDDKLVKKPKMDDTNKCVKPNGVKRMHKGAVFWPSSFRQKLCTCSECLTMYKDLNVLFLIDPEDTVFAYETLGKEKVDGRATQYEKGLEALSSLDRIQQINAVTEYNRMRDKLLDYLQSFKDKNEIVKEEDIKAFFAGMKPKREHDGVYFCR